MKNPRTELRSDILILLLLVGLAVALYLPAIHWGAAQGNTPDTTHPWEPDELAPMGPFSQLAAWFGYGGGNAQYPLFHYMLLLLSYLPYLSLELLTGRMVHPHTAYPCGFKDVGASLNMMLLIARGVSVLMGAGVVATAFLTGKLLWGRRAGVFSAAFVLLMLPMFFYARTSNVDVPGLLWVGLVILLFVWSLERGLTFGRGLWLGVFAALAVGTNDRNYSIVLPFLATILLIHIWTLRKQGASWWNRCKIPVASAAVSAGAYAVASGIALNPAKFRWHLSAQANRGLTFETVRHARTLHGQVGLWHEALVQVTRSIGWPVLGAALVGISLCLIGRRRALWLLLPFPTLYLGILALFGYVEIRYVMIWSYIVALFAGFAVLAGLQSPRKLLKAAALLCLAAGCGLELAAGVDLSYVELHDSRYTAAPWIDAHVRDGEKIQYFTGLEREMRLPSLQRLPRTSRISAWSNFSTTPEVSGKVPDGEFLFLMGQDDLEDHRDCPKWLYDRIKDGSLGYQLVASFETRPIFSSLPSSITQWAKVSQDSAVTWSGRTVVPYIVDPRIEIYARRDVAQRFISRTE